MATSLIDQPHFNKTTNFSLILANLFPIYGVLFLGWEVFDIAVFYCVETFIIGLFYIIKMIICDHDMIGVLFVIIFFLFHYNLFVIMQFIFIASYFGYPDIGIDFSKSKEEIDINVEFIKLVKYSYHNIDYLFVSIISIILSHTHSLYTNFYLGKEYLKENSLELMFKPYKRIMAQQVVAVFGGIVVFGFGSPLPLLILLVIIKTIVDLIAHNISHNEKLDSWNIFGR